MQIVFVALFGAIGVAMRYLIGTGLAKVVPLGFPWITLGINILGSFALGMLYAAEGERGMIDPHLRTALIIGLLGGFTTFSAFSLETLTMFESGRSLKALVYFIASPCCGVIAAFGGVLLTRSFLQNI